MDNDPYAELVREKLSKIFRGKGAALLDSPLLMPHSQIYGSRKPVRLLDADGTIACLPFLLNIPFCEPSLLMNEDELADLTRNRPNGGPRHIPHSAQALDNRTCLSLICGGRSELF